MHDTLKTGNPVVLAVETSCRAGSIAVGIGREVLGIEAFSGPLRHSAELFPAALRLLNGIGCDFSEIGQVYISAGPGSFTGVRIAVTLAKTMCLANQQGQTKIVAVNTMRVIAENAAEYMNQKKMSMNRVAAVLDAKRGRFFVEVFERQNDRWQSILPVCLMRAEEFIHKFSGARQPVWLLGEGLTFYAEDFKAPGLQIIESDYWQADAQKLYRLGWEMARAGQFADPVHLVPFYLREPEVKEKARN